jgi:hypothetical protein
MANGEWALRRGVLTALAVVAAARAADAQGDSLAGRPVPPATQRSVAGRILRPGAAGPVAVPGVWATLHRVGQDQAAPLDSMRTDAAGRYRFTYRAFGSADAIYFVSATHGGIAYFTAPLRIPVVTGDAAEIMVYDTTSQPIRIGARGRHIVVGSPGANERRTIVEVYELANDTTVARIAGAGARATWSTVLPSDAGDFQVGQSDVPRDAVSFRDGRVLVFSPIPPGLKQLAFSYSIPLGAGALTIPVPDSTSVLELLLEDTLATAAGPRLAAQQPAVIEGRRYGRYLAEDIPAGASIAVDLPGRNAPSRESFIRFVLFGTVAVMGVAMLFAISGRARRAAPVRPVPAAPPVDPRAADADRLARSIAELDAAFESTAAPSDAERARYLDRRAALKRELAALLAPAEATTEATPLAMGDPGE